MATVHLCRKGLQYVKRCRSNYKVFSTLSAGDSIHGFTVDQVLPVPEFALSAVQLTHDNTGARHLHLQRNDSNNTFSVGFRTTPTDSRGVAHILEHIALCGSQHFPCRDPFFNMLSRSLATYMNACTASDFTCYPFSTQNEKDFQNLMTVYLDAVFHPNLAHLDFMQEGWRLENEHYNDASTPILLKGVVFNEMKGLFSNPTNIYMRKIQNLLFPTSTYSYESGGDPYDIPKLNHDDLISFHNTHYHPSNARFYTYGDMPLEGHLEKINDVIRYFQRIHPHSDITSEPTWKQPRSEAISVGFNPLLGNDIEKQHFISMNYKLAKITDIESMFDLVLLSELLIGNPAAPFDVALLDSHLGMDLTPISGLQADTLDSYFSVGLQGVDGKDTDKVVEIIENTITQFIGNGFREEDIHKELHQLELGRRHQTAEFGLGLAMNCFPMWNHTDNIAQFLEFNKQVELLKSRLSSDKRYLQKLMEKWFLVESNPHQLRLLVKPDPDYEKKEEQKESDLTNSLVSQLNDNDKQIMYKRNGDLYEAQNEMANVSCLPSLHIEDISKDTLRTDISHDIIGGVNIQSSVQDTNGLTYLRLVANAHHIPDELKKYLPLFAHVFTQLGTELYDYKQLTEKLDSVCSGIDVDVHTKCHPTNTDYFEQGLLLSTHFLERNTRTVLDLLYEVFTSVAVNADRVDRLKTVLSQYVSGLSESCLDMGHAYALTRASGRVSQLGDYNEQFSGISQITCMNQLLATDMDEVMQNLAKISRILLRKNNLRLCVNGTDTGVPLSLSCLDSFLGGLPTSENTLQAEDNLGVILSDGSHYKPTTSKEIITVPAHVNYVAECVPFTSQDNMCYINPDFASMRIAAALLSRKYLHREIREKGGAYGSGARASLGTGFLFFSYRDPESLNTLQRFEDSCKWIIDGNFTAQDIDEAKLSVFQAIDYPIAAKDRGYQTSFLSQLKDDMIQTHRQNVFSTNKDDLLCAVQKYLSNERRSARPHQCIFGKVDTAPSEEWKKCNL